MGDCPHCKQFSWWFPSGVKGQLICLSCKQVVTMEKPAKPVGDQIELF
jgi:hypothetical protein